MLVDTHCHLNFAAFEADWQQVTDEAVKNGVERMIVVGTDLTSSAKLSTWLKNMKLYMPQSAFTPITLMAAWT